MAEAKKVLLVDDEPQIVEVLERYLTSDGFIVVKAYDGNVAVESFTAERPDVVLLDLNLPGISGLDAFHLMRAQADTPVLMLTSRTDEVDRVVGLELGADDYITKPFSPREVVSRVKAVLRRSDRSRAYQVSNGPPAGDAARIQQTQNRVIIGGLVIDPDEHEVRVDDREIALTPTEFRILEVLAAHPGRTFTRAQLLDKAKAENLEVFDRTLDRHIANLRHKVEADPGNPKYIVTVFGVGYKMAKQPGDRVES